MCTGATWDVGGRAGGSAPVHYAQTYHSPRAESVRLCREFMRNILASPHQGPGIYHYTCRP
jgi:hypothetical protein